MCDDDIRQGRPEDRVLLLAPTAKDAAAARQVFASIGIPCLVCKDLDETCREILAGAGAAIVTDDTILNDRGHCLARVLADQPAWSDFPLIVLTSPHGLTPRTSAALQSVGHMTLVRRPVEIRSLESTIRTVLRDRARQYATRDHLRERERQADALRASEERLAFALAAGSLGSWEWDLESGAFQCSPLCKAHHGLAGDAPISLQTLSDAIHPSDRGRVDGALEQSLADRSDYHVEYRNIWPDRSTHWIMVRGRGIYDAGGTPVRMAGVSLDITERKLVEEELRASEARLRAIIDSTPDCVQLVSSYGDLLEINPAGLAMLQADSYEAVIGRSIHEIIAPDHRDAYRAFHASVCRGEGGTHEFEIIGLRGSRLHVETRAVPLRDEGARVTHLSVTRDITARKQAEAEREQLLAEARRAKTEADSANRMKDEFLATLSHELRTPLNAILGWARILRSAKVAREDVEEGLAAIERNSTAQAQIIEDLLDISRIIAGKFRLEVQRVDLREITESAVAAVMPAAAARGVRIHKVLDSLAGPVSGDPARLQQIVWNLLSNAVKFTPQGGQVQVLLERVNSHVEVSVIDTGMGIKPEFLPHAFDRFRQADASTTRRHGGLGLGLAIVKQLVEMHGGTVRAKSPGEGQGATFTVALPIVVVNRQQPEKPRPKDDGPAELDCKDGTLNGVRVLVVDDEADARRLIERVLVECGAEVALASSAAEALERLDDFRPHVLVSDVGMPDQDGYDLLRSVRSRGKSPAEIPAAALTAFARSEDRRKAMLAGFQTHVAKPVDPAELLAVVASLAGKTGTD
jgi:PAS domain S-box-containing protein